MHKCLSSCHTQSPSNTYNNRPYPTNPFALYSPGLVPLELVLGRHHTSSATSGVVALHWDTRGFGIGIRRHPQTLHTPTSHWSSASAAPFSAPLGSGSWVHHTAGSCTKSLLYATAEAKTREARKRSAYARCARFTRSAGKGCPPDSRSWSLARETCTSHAPRSARTTSSCALGLSRFRSSRFMAVSGLYTERY